MTQPGSGGISDYRSCLDIPDVAPAKTERQGPTAPPTSRSRTTDGSSHFAETVGRAHGTLAVRPLVRIAPSAWGRIEDHVRGEYPEEACGYLFGPRAISEGVARPIVEARPAENEETEGRDIRYRISSAEIYRIEAEAEDQPIGLVGFYHSHPDGPGRASRRDERLAWPWYTYLILSVDDGGVRDWGAYTLSVSRGSFVPIDCRVSPEGPVGPDPGRDRFEGPGR